MKIFVTGGAGFIGSHLVDALIKSGYEVVIVDDLSTGFKDNINPKAKFYNADICNERKIGSIFKNEKPDWVNHHAAQMDVRRSTREPIVDAKVNILGSIIMLQNSLKHNIKKFIYSSSGGASYGEPEYLPMDEKHPINPICEYGVSKHTVEHYLYLYNHNYGLNYVSLRYPNIYGPRQEPENEAGVVSIFVSRMLKGLRPVIFGDGDQKRDFVFVSDAAKANLLALRKCTNKCYNLGSGREISVQDVYQIIKGKLHSNLRPIYARERVGEISRCYFRYDKIRKDLGWKPKVPFEKGIDVV